MPQTNHSYEQGESSQKTEAKHEIIQEGSQQLQITVPTASDNAKRILEDLRKNPFVLPLLFWDGIQTTASSFYPISKIAIQENGYFDALFICFIEQLLSEDIAKFPDVGLIKKLHRDCTAYVQGMNQNIGYKQPEKSAGEFSNEGMQAFNFFVWSKEEVNSCHEHVQKIKKYIPEPTKAMQILALHLTLSPLPEFQDSNEDLDSFNVIKGYLADWLSRSGWFSFTEEEKKNFCFDFCRGMMPKNINWAAVCLGKYLNSFPRAINEMIVKGILADYQSAFQRCFTEESKIECIADMVQLLSRLHPFADGNGRTFAMLLLNRELIRAGLLPTLQDDPNLFARLPLNALVERIKLGQVRYRQCIEDPTLITGGKLKFADYDGDLHLIDRRWVEEIPLLRPECFVEPKELLIHTFVKINHLPMVKRLLKHKSTIDVQDQRGNTPLHLAVANRNLDMARLLLNGGADVNAVNDKRQTPLQIAQMLVEEERVKKLNDLQADLLMRKDIDVNAKNSHGETSLHYCDAGVNTRDNEGQELFHVMRELKDLAIWEKLLECNNKDAPLQIAAQRDNLETVKLFTFAKSKKEVNALLSEAEKKISSVFEAPRTFFSAIASSAKQTIGQSARQLFNSSDNPKKSSLDSANEAAAAPQKAVAQQDAAASSSSSSGFRG